MRLGRRAAPPRATALGVVLVALLIASAYRPDAQPILSDRAYLLYMATAVHRGDPIYRTTTFGYPPLGPMISAATMTVGAWGGVSAIFAPRVLALAVVAASAGLVYAVVRHATRSVAAGVVAGLVFSGFDLLTGLAASNLEPKILAQFFSLGAVRALQRGRWAGAGVAMGLATTTMQTAVFATAAVGVFAVLVARYRGLGVLGAYVAGVAAGVLPAALYVTMSGQWPEFFQDVVVQKLWSRQRFIAVDVSRWLVNLTLAVGTARVFVLAVAALGIGAAMVRATRRGYGSPRWVARAIRAGGIGGFTFAWIVYNLIAGLTAVEYQGPVDWAAGLYLIAFWTGVGYREVGRGLGRVVAAVGAHRPRPARVAAVMLGLATVLVAPGFVVALRYRPAPTLAEQASTVRAMLPEHTARAGVLAVGAPEIYVHTGRLSPWRYMYLTEYFLDLIERLEPAGCDAILADLDRRRYGAVVVADLPPTACLRRLEAKLDDGYTRTEWIVGAEAARPATPGGDRGGVLLRLSTALYAGYREPSPSYRLYRRE
jgi:hypothetical protein